MKTEITGDLQERYLVLEEESPYKEDYRYYMLLSNHIEGILSCSLRCMDSSLRFYYVIDEMEELQSYMDREGIAVSLVLSLLTALWRLEEECHAFLLRMENILIDPDYIYYESGKFYFCYLPIYEESPNEAVRRMLEKFSQVYARDPRTDLRLQELLTVLLQETEGPFLLGQVIGRVRDQQIGQQVYDQTFGNVVADTTDPEWGDPILQQNLFFAEGKNRFRSLRDQLTDDTSYDTAPEEDLFDKPVRFGWFRQEQREQNRLRREKQKAERSAEKERKRQEKEAAKLLRREERLREQEQRLQEKKNRLDERRREEELWEMEEDPPTTFLYREDMPHRMTLVRQDGEDRMMLDDSPYYIGSDASGYVQGYIPNPVISKRHAQVLQVSGLYFLEDLGSTNGTCHNGHRLDVGERVRLNPGDHVLFANLEYHVLATRPIER